MKPQRVLLVLLGAQLLIWIDNTILNVALVTLANPRSGLGASQEQLEWSLNSYTLAFASFMLAGGALGDRFGRRAVFMSGMAVFGAASAWAAWASSPEALIAARAVMGVGSALVVPSTLALVRAVFPEGGARSRAVALWSAASGLAIALGPLLGGFLLEHFWWGSVFLVNVPVTVVTLVAAWLLVPESRAEHRAPLDLLGVGLSAAGLGILVFGITEGGRLGTWTEPRVWGLLLLGLLVVACFVVVEKRAARPSFEMSLFANSAFSAASTGVALAFFGLVGSMYYSVFYLQGVRGLSPLECGIVLVPVAVGVLAGAPTGIRLAASHGPRATAAPALAVTALTLLGYATLSRTTPLWAYCLLLLVQGLSVGVAMAPLTDAVVTVLPRARAAAGAAMTSVLRQVGAVLGVAVLGSVLAATYRDRAALSLKGLSEQAAAAVARSPEAGRAVLRQANLDRLVPLLDDSYVRAMHLTTIIAAAVVLLGAGIVAAAMPSRAAWRSQTASAADPALDRQDPAIDLTDAVPVPSRD